MQVDSSITSNVGPDPKVLLQLGVQFFFTGKGIFFLVDEITGFFASSYSKTPEEKAAEKANVVIDKLDLLVTLVIFVLVYAVMTL
jgi:hypothetical protein